MSKIKLVTDVFSWLVPAISIIAGAITFLFQYIPAKPPSETPPLPLCAHVEGIDGEGGFFNSDPADSVFLHAGYGNPPLSSLEASVKSSYYWWFNGLPMSFKWGPDDDRVKPETPDWATFTWSCGEGFVVYDLREKISSITPIETQTNLVFAPLVEKGQKEEMQESETDAYPPPP